MSRRRLLERGQAKAEAAMVDTCIVRRVTGQATDLDSGVITDTYTTLYSGPCRFQQSDVQPTESDVAEDFVLMQRIEVQLPMSTTGFQVDDVVECATSVSDPDLPGRTFRVHGLAHKTEATARRLRLRERTD